MMNRTAPKVMIVDDEADSSILRSVRKRLEVEGWRTATVQPVPGASMGEEFEAAALWEIEEERPDAVLLDVRFGDHRDDRFKGLEILGEIVNRWPRAAGADLYPICPGPRARNGRQGNAQMGCPGGFH